MCTYLNRNSDINECRKLFDLVIKVKSRLVLLMLTSLSFDIMQESEAYP